MPKIEEFTPTQLLANEVAKKISRVLVEGDAPPEVEMVALITVLSISMDQSGMQGHPLHILLGFVGSKTFIKLGEQDRAKEKESKSNDKAS